MASKKGRKMPQISATIYPHQNDRIQAMADASGLRFAHVLRQLIEAGFRSGYTPTSISVHDMAQEAHKAAQPRKD